MRKITILTILAVLALVFCVSCSSLEAEPIELDISEQLELVFKNRPDNTKLKFITDPVESYEYVTNSETFFLAWNLWQNYAKSLEDTLIALEASLKPNV